MDHDRFGPPAKHYPFPETLFTPLAVDVPVLHGMSKSDAWIKRSMTIVALRLIASGSSWLVSNASRPTSTDLVESFLPKEVLLHSAVFWSEVSSKMLASSLRACLWGDCELYTKKTRYDFCLTNLIAFWAPAVPYPSAAQHGCRWNRIEPVSMMATFSLPVDDTRWRTR